MSKGTPPVEWHDHHRDEAHNVQDLHRPILREKAEPRDGFEPIPPWLGIFGGVIIFFGGYYLATYNGNFDPAVYNENRPVGGSAKSAAPPDPLAAGKRAFQGNCAACHQPNGMGQPGQYPPLAGSEWVLGEPARIKRILLHGLTGPVTVKGETYNGNMPNLNLKDADIANVLTYIRASWGNNAGPITVESVAATRKATASRSGQMTEAELKAVTQDDAVEAPPKKDAK